MARHNSVLTELASTSQKKATASSTTSSLPSPLCTAALAERSSPPGHAPYSPADQGTEVYGQRTAGQMVASRETRPRLQRPRWPATLMAVLAGILACTGETAAQGTGHQIQRDRCGCGQNQTGSFGQPLRYWICSHAAEGRAHECTTEGAYPGTKGRRQSTQNPGRAVQKRKAVGGMEGKSSEGIRQAEEAFRSRHGQGTGRPRRCPPSRRRGCCECAAYRGRTRPTAGCPRNRGCGLDRAHHRSQQGSRGGAFPADSPCSSQPSGTSPGCAFRRAPATSDSARTDAAIRGDGRCPWPCSQHGRRWASWPRHCTSDLYQYAASRSQQDRDIPCSLSWTGSYRASSANLGRPDGCRQEGEVGCSNISPPPGSTRCKPAEIANLGSAAPESHQGGFHGCDCPSQRATRTGTGGQTRDSQGEHACYHALRRHWISPDGQIALRTSHFLGGRRHGRGRFERTGGRSRKARWLRNTARTLKPGSPGEAGDVLSPLEARGASRSFWEKIGRPRGAIGWSLRHQKFYLVVTRPLYVMPSRCDFDVQGMYIASAAQHISSASPSSLHDTCACLFTSRPTLLQCPWALDYCSCCRVMSSSGDSCQHRFGIVHGSPPPRVKCISLCISSTCICRCMLTSLFSLPSGGWWKNPVFQTVCWCQRSTSVALGYSPVACCLFLIHWTATPKFVVHASQGNCPCLPEAFAISRGFLIGVFHESLLLVPLRFRDFWFYSCCHVLQCKCAASLGCTAVNDVTALGQHLAPRTSGRVPKRHIGGSGVSTLTTCTASRNDVEQLMLAILLSCSIPICAFFTSLLLVLLMCLFHVMIRGSRNQSTPMGRILGFLPMQAPTAVARGLAVTATDALFFHWEPAKRKGIPRRKIRRQLCHCSPGIFMHLFCLLFGHMPICVWAVPEGVPVPHASDGAAASAGYIGPDPQAQASEGIPNCSFPDFFDPSLASVPKGPPPPLPIRITVENAIPHTQPATLVEVGFPVWLASPGRQPTSLQRSM